MTRVPDYLGAARAAMAKEAYTDARQLYEMAIDNASVEEDYISMAEANIGLATIVMFSASKDEDPLEERYRFCCAAISWLYRSPAIVLLARALRLRAGVQFDDVAAARSDLEASVTLLRGSTSIDELAYSLNALALRAIQDGDDSQGIAYLNESLAIARSGMADEAIAITLGFLAKYDNLPNIDRHVLFKEAQSIFRRLQMHRQLANSLVDEARLADSDLEVQLENLREAIDLFASLGLKNSEDTCREILERLI